MITFETKNSVYSVSVESGLFRVVKCGVIDPNSRFNALGQVRYTNYIRIRVGEVADFGDWHTSPVTRLL